MAKRNQKIQPAFQPSQEYVQGNYAWAGSPLPAFRRDYCAPEIAFETYREMLNDPEVSADVRTLVAMVLADGVQLAPAMAGKPVDDDAPEFTQAFDIAQLAERCLSGLRKPLRRTLKQLVEGALAYGHKLAEITWKLGEGADSGKLVLDKLSVKPHQSADFVVDAYWNLLGFVPRRSAGAREIIPAEKFLLFTLLEEDEDPRGRSTLRGAVTGWDFKQRAWPEYFRWLENCALPTTVGKLAPKQPGDVQRNSDGTAKSGGRQLSPSEAMGVALASLKNAGYIVVPNGAEVNQLEIVESAGFDQALSTADSQITKAILHQLLATNEAKFGTRAQSETHMGVLDLLVWSIKTDVAELLSGLLALIVKYNFGEEALQFTPIVSLGDTERRDWSKDASAASLLEPAVTDSQWNSITTQLGLPAPLPGEEPRRKASMPAQPENQPTQPASKPKKKVSENNAHGIGARSQENFISVRIRRAA